MANAAVSFPGEALPGLFVRKIRKNSKFRLALWNIDAYMGRAEAVSGGRFGSRRREKTPEKRTEDVRPAFGSRARVRGRNQARKPRRRDTRAGGRRRPRT